MIRIALLALTLATSSVSAIAAASDWIDAEGGRVRLVIDPEPSPGGQLRGALQIELQPGWKTYWRDPGSSGVPPSLDFSAESAVSTVEIGFPPPMHFEEGDGQSTGYDESVSLAVTLTASSKARVLSGTVFLGVCRDICVPVQSKFSVDLSKPASVFQTAAIDGAFDAIPDPARPGFGVIEARMEGDSLVIDAALPGADGNLFLAGNDAWQFGPAKADPTKPGRFEVPVQRSPAQALGASLPYTLRSGEQAVEGMLRIAR